MLLSSLSLVNDTENTARLGKTRGLVIGHETFFRYAHQMLLDQ